MEQNQNQQGRNEAGIAMLVARSLACSVEVFLHKPSTIGERYLGAQAAIAAVIMFVFPVFAPTENPTPMWLFAGAFLFMCGAASSSAKARRRRGELGPHSMYTGTPILMGKRQRETTVKGAIEPVVVWVAAAVTSAFSPLLAGYLALAGFGLLVSVNITLAAERKRMLDMHDAYMEQRRAAEEWRSMHRD